MNWFTRWREQRRETPMISARLAAVTLLAATAPMPVAAAIATIILTIPYSDPLGFGVLVLSEAARIMRDLAVVLIMICLLRWLYWLAYHRMLGHGRKAGFPLVAILVSYASWYLGTRVLGAGLNAAPSIVLLLALPAAIASFSAWSLQRTGGFVTPQADTGEGDQPEPALAGTAHT